MEANLSSNGDPQLLSDLFHALSQPLTTLRCGLGLSLQKSPDDNQNRQSLEIAAQAAESVARLIAGIRELMESANSNPAGERSISANACGAWLMICVPWRSRCN